MINRHFYKKLGKVLTVVLFIGLCRAESVGASEENMGITVSQAPAPGWNPNTAAPVTKNLLWPILLTVGGTLVLSSIVFQKIKSRVSVASVLKKHDPVPQPITKPLQVPTIQLSQPVSAPQQQPVTSLSPPQPAPQPGCKPATQPSPSLLPEKKPKQPPPVEVALPIVEKPIASLPLKDDDDDMLFKHLDLLRHLKNESEKQGE